MDESKDIIRVRCNGFDFRKNIKCRRLLTEVEVEGRVKIKAKCPVCGHMNLRVISSIGGK
ncbi:MAG: hypothetical protein LBV03_04095 [Fusobacteriales bacterium]|jgi:phage FluMu protein Com|nr:hypothetical protein [Fusobacteriales bacterium]